MEHVLGLTCLIDVTARELQRKEIQYTRAKGFDTFAPDWAVHRALGSIRRRSTSKAG